MEKEQIISFTKGENHLAYENFGAHIITDPKGVIFTLWAPKAIAVSVVGDFNKWDKEKHPMKAKGSGIWSVFIPDLLEGQLYKFCITAPDGKTQMKADPYSFSSELRPNTASIITNLNNYKWNDQTWQNQNTIDRYKSPLLIYEVHLGTWKTNQGEFPNYREIAHLLLPYVKDLGYTHIEIMPIMEHPFDGSWGYQITGFYSPTSRYGDSSDLKYLIDLFHQNQIGVILDWVPSHFCRDEHGLRMLDGTPCYESNITYLADNPQWGTSNFDYSKGQVVSFLISNAVYWIKEYHVDGLRVDAVANMLYLDFCKQPNKFTQNLKGTNENLDAIDFLKKLNLALKSKFPNTLMLAEDSSIYSGVTKEVEKGGLGFTYKWNLGWMNDTLSYIRAEWNNRKTNYQKLTFPMSYNHTEKYLLPLSHDEVVHGKKPLLEKIQGDSWQKFATLRAYFAFMMAHPGKKLLFMGGEFAQNTEWRDYEQLPWHLLKQEHHKKFLQYTKDLNHFYKKEKTLWQLDHSLDGFQWLDIDRWENCIFVFQRMDKSGDATIIVSNFTPIVYKDFEIAVKDNGQYKEVFNSDLEKYGGSNLYNGLYAKANNKKITILVPPLATLYLKQTIDFTI